MGPHTPPSSSSGAPPAAENSLISEFSGKVVLWVLLPFHSAQHLPGPLSQAKARGYAKGWEGTLWRLGGVAGTVPRTVFPKPLASQVAQPRLSLAFLPRFCWPPSSAWLKDSP